MDYITISWGQNDQQIPVKSNKYYSLQTVEQHWYATVPQLIASKVLQFVQSGLLTLESYIQCPSMGLLLIDLS